MRGNRRLEIGTAWKKQRILTGYLNRSSYGNRRIGPEAAARAYFGKPARDLTLSEAIFLAGLPQAPTRFNPWRHPEEANRKYARSLSRLVEFGNDHARSASLLVDRQPPCVSIRRAWRRISSMQSWHKTRNYAARSGQHSTSICKRRSNDWFARICRR